MRYEITDVTSGVSPDSGRSAWRCFACQCRLCTVDADNHAMTRMFFLSIYAAELHNAGYLYINAVGATQDTTSPGSAVLLTMPGSAGNPFSAGETDFTIAQNGSNWYVYAGQTAGGNPLLNLGSTDQFGLYYYQQTGAGSVYVFQPVITNLGDPDDWLLNTPSGCLPVYLTDAAPTPTVGSATPIPATFLLFGSGLAGAIGFLRRLSG